MQEDEEEDATQEESPQMDWSQEPNLVASASNTNNSANSNASFIVDGTPVIDFDYILHTYTGLGIWNRLGFIALHCPKLEVEAYELLLKYFKNSTSMWTLYQETACRLESAIAKRGARFGAGRIKLDEAWLSEKKLETSTRYEKLDNDLKNYKANAIKVREGTDDDSNVWMG